MDCVILATQLCASSVSVDTVSVEILWWLTMYICICNAITEAQFTQCALARAQCGTGCGRCLDYIVSRPDLLALYKEVVKEKLEKNKIQ